MRPKFSGSRYLHYFPDCTPNRFLAIILFRTNKFLVTSICFFSKHACHEIMPATFSKNKRKYSVCFFAVLVWDNAYHTFFCKTKELVLNIFVFFVCSVGTGSFLLTKFLRKKKISPKIFFAKIYFCSFCMMNLDAKSMILRKLAKFPA